MPNYAVTCKGICSFNLVYNVLIQLLPLKGLVLVVYFLNGFWHENEAFPKGSSSNEIIPLLVVFHFPYSKYKDVKICRYQNQNCSLCRTHVVRVVLASHPCRSGDTCVALVLHSCCQCLTRVAPVSLVSPSCCICVARFGPLSLVSSTCVVKIMMIN